MAGFGLDFEVSAVPLSESIDNGQAEAGAGIAFCGEARFENAVFDFGRDFWTVIGDFDRGAGIGNGLVTL